MAGWYRVEVQERGSTTWCALAAGSDGEFAVAWGRGAGLKFYDRASAESAQRAAQHYGIRGANPGAWKVSEIAG